MSSIFSIVSIGAKGSSKASKAQKKKKMQFEKPPTVEEDVTKEIIPSKFGILKRTKKSTKNPLIPQLRNPCKNPKLKLLRKHMFNRKGVLFREYLFLFHLHQRSVKPWIWLISCNRTKESTKIHLNKSQSKLIKTFIVADLGFT